MEGYTMRLLKCPACGGPLDTPAGESSMKCTYCGNAVVIPESLRTPAKESSQISLFSGIDAHAMLGYGMQWSEVVSMAQSGQREAAIKKYSELTGQGEREAKYMVDALAGSQSFEFNAGSLGSIHQIYPSITQAVTATTTSITRMMWWIGCGVVGIILLSVILTALPVLIGLFGGLLAIFTSF